MTLRNSVFLRNLIVSWKASYTDYTFLQFRKGMWTVDWCFSPGGLVRLLGPTCKTSGSVRLRQILGICISNSSQVMLMLLAQKPQFAYWMLW